MTIDINNLLSQTRSFLLARRGPDGLWTGRLSDSALATATAVFALSRVDAALHRSSIQRGLDWLSDHQNSDGGWGDTPISRSNISTTLLAWSAFTAADPESGFRSAVDRAQSYILAACGSLDSKSIVAAVQKRYGDDLTFAVPILAMCILAGRLDPQTWQAIPRLPWELAALPQSCFRWLRLGVVSYALPALIAIGRLIDFHRPGANPLSRFFRRWARGPTLRRLQAIQPENGGFLEATPLTAFVTMSLSDIGLSDHPVARKGVEFLVHSMRPQGCWPIDTDLSTWLTTLSVRAIGKEGLTESDKIKIADGLLARQQRRIHPYTGAAPGGWSWTEKPGGVPDADDTAGAVLALRRLNLRDSRIASAAGDGIDWLVGVQNSDGGIPTFCRGWGRLDFDRSAPDLTAHALAAWSAWVDDLPGDSRRKLDRAIRRALVFLLRSQTDVGAWLPLWFGNEATPDQTNPIFGTGRVLGYLAQMPERFFAHAVWWISRGVGFLLSQQNDDGGWAGRIGLPSTLEETGAAVEALAANLNRIRTGARIDGLDLDQIRDAIQSGIEWLNQATKGGTRFTPAPIGLYFARLWYFEELYPVIFAAGAFSAAGQEVT